MYTGTATTNSPPVVLVDDSFSPPPLDRLSAGWPGGPVSVTATGFPAFPTSVYNRAWPRHAMGVWPGAWLWKYKVCMRDGTYIPCQGTSMPLAYSMYILEFAHRPRQAGLLTVHSAHEPGGGQNPRHLLLSSNWRLRHIHTMAKPACCGQPSGYIRCERSSSELSSCLQTDVPSAHRHQPAKSQHAEEQKDLDCPLPDSN